MSEPVLADARPQAQLHPGRRHHRRAARRRSRRSQPGEIVALLGPSGSGKSTLLQAVGLLEGGFEGSIRHRRARKRPSSTTTAAPAAPRRARLRLPVPPSAARLRRASRMSCCRSSSAAPTPDAARDARRAAARRARPRRSGSTTARPSCRAASSSASRSPARSPTGRRWCWPTSRPATSTRPPPTACFAEFLSLVRGEGSAALVATHNERLAAKMDRVLRLHEGRARIVEPDRRRARSALRAHRQSDRHCAHRRLLILLLRSSLFALRQSRTRTSSTTISWPSAQQAEGRSREALRRAGDLRLIKRELFRARGADPRHRPGGVTTSSPASP